MGNWKQKIWLKQPKAASALDFSYFQHVSKLFTHDIQKQLVQSDGLFLRFAAKHSGIWTTPAASAAAMPQGAGFSGDRGGQIKRGPRRSLRRGKEPCSSRKPSSFWTKDERRKPTKRKHLLQKAGVFWYARLESNQRPLESESNALSSWATGAYAVFRGTKGIIARFSPFVNL